ncbi:type II secretion system F family protein [Mycolicibacterium fallax]|jgi:pilus assembly protein TadC|uniref:Uncharacterized protein n=1 Tax=Mycolicibacterium fallax TaxID=1793 RepID=A0A1X1RFF0_MYCFA|nr:type II secretion system F family protein [Mycolicibacterium fallax]ORV04579.1 hypothetical protein AWC04_08255 [Mycolicibacterium fallax]BBY99683.1 type II secretion system protein F [Mycolicibacterium fallax]
MTGAAVLLAAALLAWPGPPRHRVGPDRRPIGRPARGARRSDPLALAAAFDVLAVCLRAGMPVPAAARAASAAAPPELAGLLRGAADLLALGADPARAWAAPTGRIEPSCADLLRLARRSASSGTALAQGVTELADRVRQDARHRGAAAAERAGVLIAGPLGLCFLPAFVCLGIVPVIAGLAGRVLGSGVL